ncbi:unnamed protein product [Allacma fusca]|uniref:Uncharacterized protein n=1 Tax=Allacma fusca TaxID=39272 RepID=A0A8J2LKC5_9HEXA|nr:unnamed protein product [Allacma fusca]
MNQEWPLKTFLWSLAVLLVINVPEVQNAAIIPANERTADTFLDMLHILLQNASCVYPPKDLFDSNNSWYSDINRRCMTNNSIDVGQGDKRLCQYFLDACHDLCLLPASENSPKTMSSLRDSVQQIVSNVDTFCAALNSSISMNSRNVSEPAYMKGFLATAHNPGCKETCKLGKGVYTSPNNPQLLSHNINPLCILTYKALQAMQVNPKRVQVSSMPSNDQATMQPSNYHAKSLQAAVVERKSDELLKPQSVLRSPLVEKKFAGNDMRMSSSSTSTTTVGDGYAQIIPISVESARRDKVHESVSESNARNSTGVQNDSAGRFHTNQLSFNSPAVKTVDISNRKNKPVSYLTPKNSSESVNRVGFKSEELSLQLNKKMDLAQERRVGEGRTDFNITGMSTENPQLHQNNIRQKTGATESKTAGSEIPLVDPGQLVKKSTQKNLVTGEDDSSNFESRTLSKSPDNTQTNLQKPEKTIEVSGSSAQNKFGEGSAGEPTIVDHPTDNGFGSSAPKLSLQSISGASGDEHTTVSLPSPSATPNIPAASVGNGNSGLSSNSVLLSSPPLSSTTTVEPAVNLGKLPSPNEMETSIKENAIPGNTANAGSIEYEDNDGGNNRALSGENTDGDIDADDNIPNPNRVFQKSQEPADHLPRNTYKNSLPVFDENDRYHKKDEDVSFFSYFLTFITVCGVGWLVFHNKKRIIAMVVEGRRPRTARRRSSSGSYRKLENNFD